MAINFDDFDFCPVPAEHFFIIRFTPKADLYEKANEPALLLRELGQLGETRVACDFSRLPLLDELDPEASYLSWTIELRTAQDEAAIRAAFKFVEWDCELNIQPSEAAAAPVDGAPSACARMEPHYSEATLQTPAAFSFPKTEAASEEAAERTTDACKPGKPEAPKVSQATIRVDLDRVDRLINFVGELVITQAMPTQRVFEAGLARTSGWRAALMNWNN